MYFVSYDISSNKLRKKVADLLEDYGIRIQYSVFECDLDTRKYRELYAKMTKLTADMQDGSVIFCPICDKCYSKKRVIGDAVPTARHDSDEVIVI